MKDSNYLTQDLVGNLYDVSYPVIKCHGSTIGSDCVGCLVITHGQIHFTIQFSDPWNVVLSKIQKSNICFSLLISLLELKIQSYSSERYVCYFLYVCRRTEYPIHLSIYLAMWDSRLCCFALWVQGTKDDDNDYHYEDHTDDGDDDDDLYIVLMWRVFVWLSRFVIIHFFKFFHFFPFPFFFNFSPFFSTVSQFFSTFP